LEKLESLEMSETLDNLRVSWANNQSTPTVWHTSREYIQKQYLESVLRDSIPGV